MLSNDPGQPEVLQITEPPQAGDMNYNDNDNSRPVEAICQGHRGPSGTSSKGDSARKRNFIGTERYIVGCDQRSRPFRVFANLERLDIILLALN